jgi:hypothetical protein
MLKDSCAVVVSRRGAFDCERTAATSRQKIVAEMRTTARRLAREATAVLLSFEGGERLAAPLTRERVVGL